MANEKKDGGLAAVPAAAEKTELVQQQAAAGQPRPKKKRNVKKIVLISVIAAAAGLFAVSRIAAMLRGPLPVYAPTQTVAAGDITQTLTTTGTLISGSRVAVLSPVSAPLSEVLVEQGQIVRAGDPLFRFDTTALQRAYRQASASYESGQLQKGDALAASDEAQAQFNDAASNLNNLAVQKDRAAAAVNSLSSQYGALTEEEKKSEQGIELGAALDAARADLANQEQALSAAKAAYDAAQKGVLSDSGRRELELAQVPMAVSVEAARQDLNAAKAGLDAPIGGVVTGLSAVQGGMAGSYTALCTVESLEDVDVDIALSRYDLEKVRVGQSAMVVTLGRTYTGKVSSIDAMATAGAGATSTATAYVHAKIHLDAPDENLKLGLEANVSILTGEAKNVLSLPLSAVNTDVDGQFCLVVENGVAVRREVTTGLTSDTAVEITGGLSAGELVITDPLGISEGMAVSGDPGAAAPAMGGAAGGAIMIG